MEESENYLQNERSKALHTVQHVNCVQLHSLQAHTIVSPVATERAAGQGIC
jgi:hypothetical protein